MIDKGSCENMVSIKVVDKLKLSTNNPHLYKLTCFKKRNEVKVSQRCLMSFSIRKRYVDEIYLFYYYKKYIDEVWFDCAH